MDNKIYQIMIVDDSVVVRASLNHLFSAQKNIKVMGCFRDAKGAIEACQKKSPDVIILDIEMPGMNGLEALPHFLKCDKNICIIMASTLTMKNAQISLQALACGAVDYLQKPSSLSGNQDRVNFKNSLVKKVIAWGAFRHQQKQIKSNQSNKKLNLSRHLPQNKEYKESPTKKALAIGCSTGGPQALFSLIKSLNVGAFPIFITQHMPKMFTTLLASNISSICKVDCLEAKDGDRVINGRIYIAPGDYHLEVKKKSNDVLIHLTQSELENFCRPSVDVMFRSLSDCYGSHVRGLILTGMGKDGLLGCSRIVEKGGLVIVQDEKSSVVWGMPGAVVKENLHHDIVSLDDLPAYLNIMMESLAQ